MREVFPITLVLPRRKVQDGVSTGVLTITAAGIDNVASGKGGKGSGQSASWLPLLPGNQYYRDDNPCYQYKYLVTSSLETMGIQKK